MKINEIEGIFESPSMMGSSEFEFNNAAFNIKKAKQLLDDEEELIKDTAAYRFFRTGDTHDGEFVVVTKAEIPEVSYYVNYVQRNIEPIGTSVTQVMLWRSSTGPAPLGITSMVFFEILLERWKTVVSDDTQTPEGRNFWLRIMAAASEKGFEVGLINVKEKRVDWYDPNVDNPVIKDWALQSNAWGDGKTFTIMRFVIKKA